MAAQESSHLRAAFAHLGLEQTRTVLLHDLEGGPTPEVATMLGVSTAMSHVRRKRQALVGLLAEHSGERAESLGSGGGRGPCGRLPNGSGAVPSDGRRQRGAGSASK